MQGQSPYNRATYRYSPILAWLLKPNLHINALFGKLLFIQCDIMAGCFLFLILRQSGYDHRSSIHYSWLWLFNPLPMTISSRGNAESIVCLLVLASIYFLKKSSIITGSIIYGLSVHFKIYPITYALPMYLMYQNTTSKYKLFGFDVLPNWSRLKLAVTSGGTFLLCTGISYYL